ncbi:MAG: hypothetical protein A2020_14385 [Lentisphaerae bacterium GWF2_45_14]|nr:MAG: hypothetical protein A2020_14385 [Lentisphaerae bacterium GWF2_45_14]
MKNGSGWTALHYATFAGYDDIVKRIITLKANVDADDNFGHTPLHWAALNGYKTTVKILLEAGANPA